MVTNKKSAAPQGDDLEIIQASLSDLNLTVIAKSLEDHLRSAQEGGVSYSEFLRRILVEEATGRYERKLARSLKRSNLGASKSLEEFDFTVRKKLTKAAVMELLGCHWIKEGRSIICVGRSGTGKTHLAKALAKAACMKGYSVLYVTAADMLDEIHAALADNTYHRIFKRYEKVDLLVCEELGYLPLKKEKADHLFRLVSARHPTKPMLVTANTGFENWGKFFPSQAQAIATIDRLIDQATILRFTGKTFRKPKEVIGESLEEE